MSNSIATLKNKHVRLLNDKTVQIVEVYKSYRSGGIEVDGKFVGKDFILFPKSDVLPDVIVGNDERVAELNKTVTETEYREKKWDKEARTFTFERYKGKLDRDFYSVYKKVYDVVVKLNSPITVSLWNSDSRQEEPTLITDGSEVTIKAFAASKIKTMCEDLDLDKDVVLVDGKDKAGNAAKVKPFDWEDGVIPSLINKYVVIRVRGEGMDTKYKFKEGEAPLTTSDIPF
jgi:hypothetical protein